MHLRPNLFVRTVYKTATDGTIVIEQNVYFILLYIIYMMPYVWLCIGLDPMHASMQMTK
jgi:hypothetical protein